VSAVLILIPLEGFTASSIQTALDRLQVPGRGRPFLIPDSISSGASVEDGDKDVSQATTMGNPDLLARRSQSQQQTEQKMSRGEEGEEKESYSSPEAMFLLLHTLHYINNQPSIDSWVWRLPAPKSSSLSCSSLHCFAIRRNASQRGPTSPPRRHWAPCTPAPQRPLICSNLLHWSGMPN
jgi:hypothetical protein